MVICMLFDTVSPAVAIGKRWADHVKYDADGYDAVYGVAYAMLGECMVFQLTVYFVLVVLVSEAALLCISLH